MGFTPEEQRLLGLVRELTSRSEYATGDATFPGPLARADAIAIAADLQAVVDQGTEARAEVIAGAGVELACRPGCAACCDQLVAVYAAEAELVADWLNAPERSDIKAGFLASYPRWRELTGDRVERIAAATDAAAQHEVVMEQWRSRVRCAFNRDGLCSIYPVRPVLCRTVHAVGTSDHCHPADSEVAPRTLHFVPLEEFMAKTRALRLAMHHALGGKRMQAEVLCVAAYQRLTQRS